jgi:hypothetical protein
MLECLSNRNAPYLKEFSTSAEAQIKKQANFFRSFLALNIFILYDPGLNNCVFPGAFNSANRQFEQLLIKDYNSLDKLLFMLIAAITFLLILLKAR